MHKIHIILYPGYQLLDVAGPMAVFEAAFEDASGAHYDVRLLSADGGPIRSSGGAWLNSEPFDGTACDTLLICGGIGALDKQPDQRVLDYLLAHQARERRTASVCTGAFLLARAGLLDGRVATTHWRFAADLAQRHPALTIDQDRIWVRDGSVWTSAGVTAGIDLALALVTEDLGEAMARRIAQELVVYHRRPGGQSQFSALLDMVQPAGRFGELLGWIREHLHEELSIERLADRASMSPRNFARAFTRETGVTPGKAIERIRVEAAREWVERDTHSLTHIARNVGFGSADRMRLSFIRAFGMPPQAIRRVF